MASVSSRLCILAGPTPSFSAQKAGTPFADYEKHLIESALAKSGFNPSEVHYKLMNESTVEELNGLELDLIITLGEEPLKLLTGKSSIDKWSLSPLTTTRDVLCKKVLPTFCTRRLNKQFEYKMFFFQTFKKAWECMYAGEWKRKQTRYRLVYEEADVRELIRKPIDRGLPVSVDIETSRGTINTLGFAWSANDAIAIRCEPGYYSHSLQRCLWDWAAGILEDPCVKKILQNNVYEGTYFSRYGIQMRGVWHDTMWAQKLLYPEFKQGLAIVGQIFTNEIYWKEDGKDWTNIDNWKEHLLYNCKDTSNTYEAAMNQRIELEEKGMLKLYDDYLIRLAEPLNEMCSQGLRVDEKLREQEKVKTLGDIDELVTLLPPGLNHRSPKQKIVYLKSKGYKIPKTRGLRGMWKDSVDELSLLKLKSLYPDDGDIDTFLALAKMEKYLSSYVEFQYHDDGVMRYTIRGTGTETLRFAGGTDSWGLGLNPQTIPKKAKKLFLAPEKHQFIQVDLRQAESRYVAYRAKEYNLIQMLEDPTQDVHSYVAASAFSVPIQQVLDEKNAGDPSKRQLGKKAGHGANYAMSYHTFREQCFKEGLVLTTAEARNILETYHNLFPGLRRWHGDIKRQLYDKGWLENPLGFRRHFWGRKDDTMFREAYAFEPQSTIPMITNHMLLYLLGKRTEVAVDFNVHLQVHDSIVLSAREQHINKIAEICYNTDLWHPEILFPVGKLVIPTEVEVGPNLKDMQAYQI